MAHRNNPPRIAPHDACMTCFRGDTETAFALEAPFEDHVAFHVALGITDAQAVASTALYYQRTEANIDEPTVVVYRICPECAATIELPRLSRPGKDGAIEVFRIEAA